MTQQVTAMVYPLRFTPSSANPASISPLAGANLDVPGLFWAGATASYLVVDLGSVQAIDTIALIGTNLRSTDTWRVRSSTSDTGGLGGSDSGSMAPYGGFAIQGARTDAITILASPITARFVRIDVNSPSNADAMVFAQRIVIGKAARSGGVDQSAEKTTDDQSIITSGAGYEAVDEFPTYSGWKVSLAWIDETNWRQNWEPIYNVAGSSRAVLFIPDVTTPELWQTDAVFGRITSKPSGKNEDYDGWVTNPTIQAVSSKLRNR